jgi:3-methyladenine DNA glycosylase AlkD
MTVSSDLGKIADPERARVLSGFFKTGKGEYGEGDVFLGVTVPEIRKIAKRHAGIRHEGIRELLSSEIHEERLAGLLILVDKFGDKYRKARKNGDGGKQKRIFDFYLANAKKINNWDLVDLSAPQIVGGYLLERKGERSILRRLARSENVWERRIAVMATLQFIRSRQFDDTLEIAEMLLGDRHDLIHKAVGWMLREIGKRDQAAEEKFLKKHFRTMPRTMLRYAIEKFDAKKRRFYMRG